ncbi:hypothetical protein [Nonomuraea sp. NPDC049141]|uniref:hypothetical protein n=1 Tax=Nonomuraea sp. NPDC049141 TaxID=3155500 RepID=UPI00340604CF
MFSRLASAGSARRWTTFDLGAACFVVALRFAVGWGWLTLLAIHLRALDSVDVIIP